VTAPKKNTRRAALDAERFDWKCFRFADDKRQWKPIARERRAYFVKAANAADQDGTRVEISIHTFMKAGGERATASRRIKELAQMCACLPELHIDSRGHERELLSPKGTKVRRLLYDSLNAAQTLLDAGQIFPGHARLSDAEQLAIQRGWLCQGISKWCEGVSNSPAADEQKLPVKQYQSQVKESQSRVKESQSHAKEYHVGDAHTEVRVPNLTEVLLPSELKDRQEKTALFESGTRTVEQSVGRTANLEDMLMFLSDNTIEHNNPLMDYENVAELKTAVQDALARESKTVVTDRLVLRKLMERINSALRAEDIQPPRFWLPVMLTLKKGGPIQMQPSKYRCQVCNGPTNGESICDACSMAA
jgi:hypothetical protein